jgi:ABC-type antimicrobial peptide transport system permease subunit
MWFWFLYDSRLHGISIPIFFLPIFTFVSSLSYTHLPPSSDYFSVYKHPSIVGSTGKDVNGTHSFRSISTSVSIFEDMVCTFRKSPDMDANVEISQVDI